MEQRKHLYRNLDEKMLAGVAAGFADYFVSDATLWRMAFILATFLTGGVFILVYVCAWLLVPVRPQDEPVVHEHRE